MSASNSSLPADAFPPPPPGTNYVAAIKPSLNLLMIGTVWTSFLIPITIALFFFSTPDIRRRPVFILNLVSIALGLVQGAVNIYNQTRAILAKPIQTNVYVPYVIIVILIPMFSEFILVLRVLAAYPPRKISLKRRFLVYGPIVMMKLARFGNNIVFATTWARNVRSDSLDVLKAGQASWNGPFAKIEWFLMLFDTSYVSFLFLSRLHEGSSMRESGVVHSSASAETQGTVHRRTYGSRLKALFWIAVSNFVFPVILNLVQLIFVFRDPYFFDGTYVFFINTYVQIIGVLLATIWSTGTRWYEVERDQVGTENVATSITFAPRATGDSSWSDHTGPRGEPSEGTRIYELKLRDVNSVSGNV